MANPTISFSRFDAKWVVERNRRTAAHQPPTKDSILTLAALHAEIVKATDPVLSRMYKVLTETE
jgi:hypothetical protein